jgi:hypothetical protein
MLVVVPFGRDLGRQYQKPCTMYGILKNRYGVGGAKKNPYLDDSGHAGAQDVRRIAKSCASKTGVLCTRSYETT